VDNSRAKVEIMSRLRISCSGAGIRININNYSGKAGNLLYKTLWGVGKGCKIRQIE
jgi:hypothetical protein